MASSIRKTRTVPYDEWCRIVSSYRFFSGEDMRSLPIELRLENSWRPVRCEDDALGLPVIMVSVSMHAWRAPTSGEIDAIGGSGAKNGAITEPRDPDKCPRCGSSNIEGDSPDFDRPHVYQRVACLECGFRWADAYVYESYLPLE